MYIYIYKVLRINIHVHICMYMYTCIINRYIFMYRLEFLNKHLIDIVLIIMPYEIVLVYTAQVN